MKKILLGMIVAFLTASVFMSCSKDDGKTDVIPEPEQEPEPIVYSEVGVWESGQYFLALSEDHTLTAYVAPNFIDAGTYKINDDKIITCTNNFYVRTTTYSIKSLDDKNMSVDIKYINDDGDEKNTSLNLVKSDKNAPSRSNPLVGKTYNFLTNYFGIVTYSFESDNLGMKTSTSKNASRCPIRLFYITLEDLCYFKGYNYSQAVQVVVVGGWNDSDMSNLDVLRFTIGAGGVIDDMTNVSKDVLK
ncbi:MAG: hypothetical protein IKZ99_06605 [Salinivirgaceae bacterium]|nr:hypothetical protein [Salinivirgaceae bacterium]